MYTEDSALQHIEDTLYPIFVSTQFTFDLNSMYRFYVDCKDESIPMPMFTVRINIEDDVAYFEPSLTQFPGLYYDDMTYADSYEYIVENWLDAAKLCRKLVATTVHLDERFYSEED